MKNRYLLVAGTLLILGLAHLPGPALAQKEKPKYTNRLAKETSPYLLMHAHNPTDWHAWGPEAFEKAKKEGKLVFLSIGYSSCYWCHVMERESFNNEEVAKLLNKDFVCIKVDREERPDIDQIYMTAVNALGQQGGWPLSMFLMPDGRPIVGGTYWPREDKSVEGRKYNGFKTILNIIATAYKDEPKAIENQANQLSETTRNMLETRGIALVGLEKALVKDTVAELKDQFDPQYGGFGSRERGFRGTKFPTPPRLTFLLQHGERNKDTEAIDMVTLTLDTMAHGGIYDQLGGGFHRYSTERTWTVPHFEKMLYDNAQLVEVYADAYRLTKKPLYRRIIDETLAYVQREMTSPEGAFYSSQDAETDEEEGRFYVWTSKELEAALPARSDLEFIRTVYGATGVPNFEEKYHILTMPLAMEETAKKLGMSAADFAARLGKLKQHLLEVRGQREKPLLNQIALTAWSGLMIGGCARAGQILNEAEHIDTAKRAANFVLKQQLTEEGRLLRTYGAAPGQPPKAAVAAYLEDYAFLVHGLLNLYEATKEKVWLDHSQRLTDAMIVHYGDDKRGGFYFTAHDHEKLFARSKDQHDGATPSGNSVAASNLVRLWRLTSDDKYKIEADKTFRIFAMPMKTYPTSLCTMAQALELFLGAREGQVQVKDLSKDLGTKKPEEEPLKVVVAASEPVNGKQTVTVTLKVEKGWHVYANPPGNPDLAGGETRITIKAKQDLKDVKVNYPAGDLAVDKLVGNYRVYKGLVKIESVVERTPGDTSPLEVSIRYQACNENACLLPKTIKLLATPPK